MAFREMIRDFIEGEILGNPDQNLSFDDDLLMSGVLDSLAVMRLVDFIERKTGKRVPSNAITVENFETIDAIAGYLGID